MKSSMKFEALAPGVHHAAIALRKLTPGRQRELLGERRPETICEEHVRRRERSADDLRVVREVHARVRSRIPVRPVPLYWETIRLGEPTFVFRAYCTSLYLPE